MNNRAVIYARFSTDLQNERSIEDQTELCRSYARREGLQVVKLFEDRAKSGASILNRDGLLDLMDQAKSNRFDVVVVEALDRLSRDMEDLAGIHKRLSFAGIQIRAVHEGVANSVLVGLRGLVGQLYREDTANKVRRGLSGRVRAGLSGGGITYGYKEVPGEPGKRVIFEPEADVVRRIFSEYIAGRTPRAIAHDLNRDNIPPPRGRRWGASSVNGSSQRGTGIIRCELYVGRLVWNKVRMVKDPETGKRVSRPNPPQEWQIVEVPDLAIVSREVFDAAQQRKAKNKGTHFNKQWVPKRLLSGLLRCAACGGGMSSNGADKTGRVRVRCTTATESGTCPEPQTFYVDAIESTVVAALRAELKDPNVIKEYVRTYHEERQRLAAAQIRERANNERRLGELTREIARLVDYIAKGLSDPESIAGRLNAATAERRQLEANIAMAGEPLKVIALHPAAIEDYGRKLERLQAAIAEDIADGSVRHAALIRDLVHTVTVSRSKQQPDALEIEITGELNKLLGDNSFPSDAFPNGVVVGASCSGPPLPRAPVCPVRRHRQWNVPATWMTTSGRTGCRGAARSFAPSRSNLTEMPIATSTPPWRPLADGRPAFQRRTPWRGCSNSTSRGPQQTARSSRMGGGRRHEQNGNDEGAEA